MIKSLVRLALSGLGLEIRRKVKDDGRVVVGLNSAYISQLGRPKTVIDVGVGFGTQELYEAFPSAKFLLVEPLRDFQSAIRRIETRYDCIVEYVGASDHEGTTTIQVDPLDLQLSSIADRNSPVSTGRVRERRDIQLKTLDRICSDHPELQPPFFLKIDTEGHEMAALRGAEEVLKHTETALIEVSISPRFAGVYRFEDLISHMRDRGFGVASIVNVAHAPDKVRPQFADIAFQRRSKQD